MNKGNDIQAEANVALRKESQELVDDPLALYESESPGDGAGIVAAPVVAPPSSSVRVQTPTAFEDRGPISLDQVLNRLGHIAWPEAVAIVHALCSTLTSDVMGGNAAVPDLPHISITSQGTVVVGGWAAPGEPGPRLARALHSLSAGGTVPVPVRLFITKWASATTQHSITDFGKELVYFARPDGAALIRGVYERAAALPAVSKPPAAVVQDPATKSLPKVTRRKRSRWVAAAVIVVSAAAAAFVAAGMSTSSGQASTLAVAGFVDQTVNAARQVAGDLAERAGFATATSGASSQPAAPAQEARPAGTRAAAAGARGGRATGARAAAAASTAAAAATPPIALGFSAPDSEPVFAAPALSPADAQANVNIAQNSADAEPQIYSIEDRDVTPPEIRHPQLPPPLFSGVEEDRNTIELIISATGAVERVRLLSQPRRMADMMLLSGAKTWSFEPASKQGQAVRYRLLLSWAATP